MDSVDFLLSQRNWQQVEGMKQVSETHSSFVSEEDPIFNTLDFLSLPCENFPAPENSIASSQKGSADDE